MGLGGQHQARVQQALHGDVGRVARGATDLALPVDPPAWELLSQCPSWSPWPQSTERAQPASVAGQPGRRRSRACTVPVRLPNAACRRRRPPGRKPLSADRGLRVPLGLRGRALVAPSGNVEWMCLPRMDGPSIFGAMLDRDAGSLQARAGRHRGARGPPLPAGHDGPRDDVGHAHRLGHRPRRAADRAVAPRRRALAHAPPLADRHRRRPRAAAHDALRQRLASRCTWSASRAWTTAASASPGSTPAPATAWRSRTRRGRRDRSCAHDRPAARLRGRPRPRAHDAARGRHGVRRADLDRARRARDLRRGLPAARLHRRLLARVARARRVPRPPVADVPAAQRADAEGPHLRADRRDGRGGDDVAARDARAASATGTTATRGSATRRSCSGACTRSASTRRPTTSSTSSTTSPPRATTSCR